MRRSRTISRSSTARSSAGGGRVNLIGESGRLAGAICAALYPEQINTLTFAGAPIDFHAGEPVVHEVRRHLARGGDLRFWEAMLEPDGGVLKGEHMVAGFVIDPARL